MNNIWKESLFDATAPPSLALVAAHPDDEIVGAGGQLRRWPGAHVIHVTDGALRTSGDTLVAGAPAGGDYASIRRAESAEALSLAGISARQQHWLGFADQETPLHLVSMTESLLAKLLEFQPQIVITQPYEGGHPDHDSTAFAVHAACDILQREQGTAPAIVEFTSYFNRAGIMATSEFLPGAKSQIKTLVLSETERQFKDRLLACFKSQEKYLQYFPAGIERFRLAPRYDFTRPPHDGRLYYELFDWGSTGERWSKLAAAALKQLAGSKETGRHIAAALAALHA